MKFHTTSYCITTTSSERCIFTLKMADSAIKMAAVHHQLFRLSDVNASMPISKLRNRSDFRSFILVCPPVFGVSAVPWLTDSDGQLTDRRVDVHWRTGDVQVGRTFWRTDRGVQWWRTEKCVSRRTTWLTDRSLRDLTWRTTDGQFLIGSSADGSLLAARAAGTNSEVHNLQYNC